MPSTVFDSAIFRDFFGTPAMRAISAMRRSSRAMSRSRWRWRRPKRGSASSRPSRRGDRGQGGRGQDRPRQAEGRDRHRRLSDRRHRPPDGRSSAARPARYLHWGATTQDIMDTATVLQIRDALDIVDADLTRSTRRSSRSREAPRHGDGRAHAPAARAARHLRLQGRRLAVHDRGATGAARGSCARACWSAQFSGAAGTLASLGDQGLAVQTALADELELAVPDDHLACGARCDRGSRRHARDPVTAASPRSRPTSC